MQSVILQMAALILCGVVWRFFKPAGVDADSTRNVLATVVYYLLLPALVLKVLWEAPLDARSMQIAFLAAVGVLASAALATGICHRCRHSGRVTGAVILAAAFPNATYMGLPVLESIMGEQGAHIAIQYDLFACTPLLLTLGVLLARYYGHSHTQETVWLALLKVPPLWAAMLAMGLNASSVPLWQSVHDWLDMLASGVVPLMLFSLGLSLRWDTWRPAQMPLLLPVIALQLFVTPVLIWGLARLLGLQGDLLLGVVLEAAMPSMVLGLVLCDRYHLDTGLYAAAVTLTTAASLLTLPLWFEWVS